MSAGWPDDGPTLPVTRGSVLGAALLVLGFMILVLTPPGSMSPWVFGAASMGIVTGLAFIVRAYAREGM